MLPLTESLPKAMLPVRGRPFVEWQLEVLARQGVGRVTICAGHLAGALREHVGDGSRWGVAVTWVDDGAQPLGTAGALRRAIDEGSLEDAFFVLYGDSYLEADMSAVESSWRASGLPALMTILLNEGRWGPGNAIYEDGRVVLYDKSRPAERVAEMRWIDYGLSIVTVGAIRERLPQGATGDLAGILRDLSLEGRLAGHEVHGRFYEVGSPAGLADLEAHLAQLHG
jgi:NDP-sugar pyrophosphorylase family protein